MSIIVEGFPEIVERLVSWFRASINQDTYLWLFQNISFGETEGKRERKITYVEHSSDCVEEPAVGVNLFLILRFDDQDNLHGDQV
jgi:hypothetical protein